jgi:hypothetical protein
MKKGHLEKAVQMLLDGSPVLMPSGHITRDQMIWIIYSQVIKIQALHHTQKVEDICLRTLWSV